MTRRRFMRPSASSRHSAQSQPCVSNAITLNQHVNPPGTASSIANRRSQRPAADSRPVATRRQRPPWLRVYQLPAHAPDLDPVEGNWSVLKRGVLANLAAASFAHLVQVIWHGLKNIQYEPYVIEGCLAEPGWPWTRTDSMDITN